MKKSIVAGLALLAIAVAACNPTKPPPPPPPPPPNVDVLLVGDSVGFGVGCMLGDNGPDDGQNCPPQPGFSTFNGYLGACAVAEGQILLYNHTAVEGNCNAPTSDATSLWPAAVDAVDAELVVIVTGGWEIVDRWGSLPPGCDPTSVFFCSEADHQFGDSGVFLTNAINNYKNEMKAVITAMQNTASSPKVLLLNSPYVAPDAPDPSNVWYEAYPQVQPGNWFPANQNTLYKPSEDKIDDLNVAVAAVVAELNSPEVELFNFWVEFSPEIGGDEEFSFTLCEFPDNKLNPNSCPVGSPPFTARLSDAGHLTTAGNDLLGDYLVPKVHQMLGIP